MEQYAPSFALPVICRTKRGHGRSWKAMDGWESWTSKVNNKFMRQIKLCVYIYYIQYTP